MKIAKVARAKTRWGDFEIVMQRGMLCFPVSFQRIEDRVGLSTRASAPPGLSRHVHPYAWWVKETTLIRDVQCLRIGPFVARHIGGFRREGSVLRAR